jgi:hypothetical protein
MAQRLSIGVLAALVLGVLAPALASAQLTTNNYNIDLFTSPVLGPGRIVGMGGAHVAIASGIDGAVYNPVGYAERLEKEIKFFAFDITGGIWLGGLFRNYDFDNNGGRKISSADTLQVTLGTRFQFAQFGVGASALLRLYRLKDQSGHAVSDVGILTVRAGAGYAFLDGGLVIGAAMVYTAFDISKVGSSQTFDPSRIASNQSLVSFTGYGAEIGALVRPKRERYRAGAVFRTPIQSKASHDDSTTGDDGLERAQGFVVPSGVHVPWEVDLGFAYQFGERRANVPWRNTRDLRRELRMQILNGTYQPPPTYGEAPYPPLPADLDKAVDAAIENYNESERRLRRHQPRRYVLLAADFLVYGKTPNGQSISGFLSQTPERSGDHVAYSVRVGAESEIWQDRMKVRLGTYLEPSRVSAKYYRPHGTLGVEARLFDFWGWSARGTATVDGAPRYFNWGLALGLWW